VDWLRRILGGRPNEQADAMEQRQTEQPGRFQEEAAEHRADRQQADTTGLVREGDPRGGVAAEAYNTADPRDLVEEGGVAMGGPGGAPQEGTSPAERRAEQRDDEGT
jgi:hypothetical protein